MKLTTGGETLVLQKDKLQIAPSAALLGQAAVAALPRNDGQRFVILRKGFVGLGTCARDAGYCLQPLTIFFLRRARFFTLFRMPDYRQIAPSAALLGQAALRSQ